MKELEELLDRLGKYEDVAIRKVGRHGGKSVRYEVEFTIGYRTLKYASKTLAESIEKAHTKLDNPDCRIDCGCCCCVQHKCKEQQ